MRLIVLLAIVATTGMAVGARAAVAASTLIVTKSGSGSGNVISDVGGMNCGAVCSVSYADGIVVTLTASPNADSQFTGWLGVCTGMETCKATITAAMSVSATFAPSSLGTPKLDIDGSARCDALTDGLLAIRYLFGLNGTSLTNGAVASDAARSSIATITAYLTDIEPVLDIDGNGKVDALTDGLLIVRYMFGLRGAALIADAVGTGATRTMAADIEAKLAGACPAPAITTIFTILLENHDYAEIVGSANAPYINSLIASYGLATNYMAASHPSLPNYLYLISGSTQGTAADPNPADPPFPVAGNNLGNQMQTAGIAWRSYQESMGTPCTLTVSGNYAPRHNPFLYFSNIQNGAGGLCAATNRDYRDFAADLAAGTYRYMWITPDLLSDGHDGPDPVTSLKTTDAWLSTEVPKILASNAYKSGGVIFITWDEAVGRNGNSSSQVPMIVVSPKIKAAGYKSGIAYDHASYLATVQDILGLARLGAAQTASNLLEFLVP